MRRSPFHRALLYPSLLSGALALASGHAVAATAWVSNEKDNSLSLIDMQTLQVTETLPVGQRPRGLLLSHDNRLLYICASDSDRVQVMDVATRKIIKELPSGKDPEQFALHPNDRWLYVSNEDDALVTVIDTQTDKVLGQIDVGIEPEGMAVSPDGKWAVNTSETTNMLHWIDTSTQTLAESTPVDQRPGVLLAVARVLFVLPPLWALSSLTGRLVAAAFCLVGFVLVELAWAGFALADGVSGSSRVTSLLGLSSRRP